MRFSLAAVVVSCGLLASCAYQGVIVDKSAHDLPFGETIGIGGSLAFMLKDTAGMVRRQIVTPEVFARYEVGDYFNDLQSGPSSTRRSSDGKTMLTAMNPAPHPSAQRVARSKTKTAHAIAKKTSKTQQRIAASKRAKTRKIAPTVTPAQARVVAVAPQPAPAEVAFIGVTQIRRCR